MRRILYGQLLARAVCVAASLGIPVFLREGPQDSDHLARLTSTNPDALKRLLLALTHFGIFKVTQESSFELTPLGTTLLPETPGSALATALLTGSIFGEAWTNLEQAVRSGRPSFNAVFGTDLFQYLQSNTEVRRVFDESQARGLELELHDIAQVIDLRAADLVIDIGGGDGTFLVELLSRWPMVKGLSFDIDADAVARAGDAIATTGYSGRISAQVGDFFEAMPVGGSVYLLRHILHDWDDDSCVRILRDCRRAMLTGGRVLIVELAAALGNNELNQMAALMDIYMLSVTSGKERRLDQIEKLLSEADLTIDSHTMLGSGSLVIMACAAPSMRQSSPYEPGEDWQNANA